MDNIADKPTIEMTKEEYEEAKEFLDMFTKLALELVGLDDSIEDYNYLMDRHYEVKIID